MNLRPIISAAVRKNHKNAILLFLVTSVTNLFPLVASLLLTIAQQKWAGWEPFYSAGEFYIYSTALLGPSWYTFYTYKKKNTDKLSIMFMVSILMVFISSILYAFLIVNRSQFSNAFLEPSSVAILFLTFIIYYYASFTDQAKRVNIAELERGDIDDIKNQLGS